MGGVDLFQSGVPKVLDHVVGAPGKMLGDLGPFVAEFSVEFFDLFVLFESPGVLFDLGVQLVVPTLATLLADTTAELLSDERPFRGAVFVHEFDHHGIFLGSPRPFDEAGVEHLLPAMEALNVLTARDFLGNLFPVLGPMFHNNSSK